MRRERLSCFSCGLFLAALLFTLLPLISRQSAVAQALPASSLPSPLTQGEQIREQLVGRWEFLFGEGQRVPVIFTADGQTFALGLRVDQQDTAVRAPWSIDFTRPQPQVVVDCGPFLLVGSPSETDMQMQIFRSPLEQNSQPFPEVISIRKVSADTRLPGGVTVIDVVDFARRQTALARQSEAKSYVGAINRSQQAYFLENQQFANAQAVEDYTGIDLKTENYDYQISITQEGRVANVVAIPKRSDLNTYVGRVITRSIAGEIVTVSILCESDRPTQTPVALPAITADLFQCPAGYQSLN